jgi:hypothetical protein
MKPTYYLNLQVCCQEDDKGWIIISEKIIHKTIDISTVYGLFDAIKTSDYKPDDSLLAEDNA